MTAPEAAEAHGHHHSDVSGGWLRAATFGVSPSASTLTVSLTTAALAVALLVAGRAGRPASAMSEGGSTGGHEPDRTVAGTVPGEGRIASSSELSPATTPIRRSLYVGHAGNAARTVARAVPAGARTDTRLPGRSVACSARSRR